MFRAGFTGRENEPGGEFVAGACSQVAISLLKYYSATSPTMIVSEIVGARHCCPPSQMRLCQYPMTLCMGRWKMPLERKVILSPKFVNLCDILQLSKQIHLGTYPFWGWQC